MTRTLNLAFVKLLIDRIRLIGDHPGVENYEKRKLGVFNLLNFFGLLTGICVPIAGLFNNDHLPPIAWVVACSPAFIGLVVLLGNHFRKYEISKLIYFLLYPLLTSLVYVGKIETGLELFFILYAILSVFFLKHLWMVIVSYGISATCYFLVFVIWKDYGIRLEHTNFAFFVINHLVALVFIFFSLYLIRQENTGYQSRILKQNKILHNNNLRIHLQKSELMEKTALLQEQTLQLQELDSVKNKLFSVISHDLRTPIYALRNLFNGIQQYNLPPEDIKVMVPDVIQDLNYTTSLLENLLQWAKSQMKAQPLHPQLLDVSHEASQILQLLRLQADNKRIYIENKIDKPVFVFADKDSVNLVLRNLLSNAIKFTPEEGNIHIGVQEQPSFVEIYVSDTGKGLDEEQIGKLMKQDYFTTRGTSNESGTGLGLMLCNEYLSRNGGRMLITSEPGKGSRFSFLLPKGTDNGRRLN